MKIDGECPIELIGSCRNKVQVYRSVRMPQLHTSLHFHLTPIVMINGSSRRDLLLNSQNFCRSIPAGAENPSLSRLCYRRLWGSRNRRALILGWAYYLDAFSSYPLRTWLPSVYRGHDNWYTRGVSPHTWSYDFAETCVFGKQSPGPGHCDPLCEEAPLLPKLRGYFAEFLRESCLAPLGILYLPTCVGFGYRYPFVEGRSSFSWEYGMGYFSAVAPGTRTLARGIFSTPSYPEKAGSPYALTHPPWTNLAEEPLGFRGIGFSPMFALLKPTFSLPLRPLPLARVLHSKAERSPTDVFLHPTASADRLAPFIFGARALDQLAFATAPVGSLNQATAYESPAHSSTGTRSEPRAPPTAWELTVSCSISLPDGGSFHPSLTVLLRYRSPRRCSILLLRLAARRLYCSPTTPFSRFRLLPFRSPLLRESLLLSFPLATKMFQFARLSLACPWIQQQFERLTYSGISGSMLIFNSPKHFVAYYALPRLWVPRYPP
ncbi:hypothetical protein OSB04_un001460 [Centaurea solstitialis]|uniref:Uncharacterized protein n=1 Tax=Centaurea solstitialis TaxID=347529 RepID=A0AA38S4B4_9ASTR|nr:hypothetical protein OSB04_un001460 [Centaurea solstitialis]